MLLPSVGSLETLPMDVIPNGPVQFNNDGINMANSCTQYVDRFNAAIFGALVVDAPYAGLPQTQVNTDGFIRIAFISSDITVDSAGLHGSLSTSDPLDWTASYPYFTRISIPGGLSLDLANSQITSGSGGSGTVEMNYHQTVDDSKTGTFEGTFSSISVGPRGDLQASVSTSDNVDWDAFSIPQPTSWELYTGPITSHYPPALSTAEAQAANTERAIMWRSRPENTMEEPEMKKT